MDRRNELRFQIYTSAKIALFDEPEREMEAQMVDVSASGVRFHTDTELLEDQIITIETDQHFVLADVRNCKPRGIRFGVGAERVHTVAKFSLPRSESKAERNQALAADYHRRIQDELEKPVVTSPKRSNEVAARLTDDTPPLVLGIQPLSNAVSQESQATVATEPAPPKPVSAWKGRATTLLSIFAVAALLLSLPGLFGHHVPAAHRTTSVNASTTPVLVVDSVVPKADSPGHSRIVIGARGRSWVTVCADQRTVFSKLFDQGSQGSVDFVNRAVVRAGNAGLTDISVDGTPLAPFGQAGQVRAIELTPGSSRILSGGDSGGCSSAQ